MPEREDTNGTETPQVEQQIRNLVDFVVGDLEDRVSAAEAIELAAHSQQAAGPGESSSASTQVPTAMAPPAHIIGGAGAANRGNRRLLTAAAVVLVVVGVAVGYFLTRDSSASRIATTPDTSGGFDSWGPGWHQIDRSGLPTDLGVTSIAWFKGRLIVVGSTLEGSSDVTAHLVPQTWTYEPQTKKWTNIPTPNLVGVALIASGDYLVAVGTKPDEVVFDRPQTADLVKDWATWAGGDAQWVEQPAMPVRADYMNRGPGGAIGLLSNYLILTDAGVLDLYSGYLLHPDSGDTSPIALPKGLITYRSLASTGPVWTGSEVVWPPSGSFADEVGLKWNDDGSEVSEIPGPPLHPDVSEGTRTGVGGIVSPPRVLVVARGGRVLAITTGRSEAPYVQSFDPKTDKWHALKGGDRLADPACFYGAATKGDDVVFVPCQDEVGGAVPMLLRGSRWLDTKPLPGLKSAVMAVISAQAGLSLVVWSMPVPDAHSEAKYYAAVWVPEPTSKMSPAERRAIDVGSVTTLPGDSEGSGSEESTVTTLDGETSGGVTSLQLGTPECDSALTALPDFGRFLPANLDTGPTPGTGGSPGVPTCARFWGSSKDPAVHVTQGPGPSSFGGPEVGRSGNYAWSKIEDGWKIEYFGNPMSYLNIYGLTQEQVASLATTLAAL